MRAIARWLLPCTVLVACGDSTSSDDTPVATVSFENSAVVISQGENRTLPVTFRDAQGKVLRDVNGASWTSSNTNLVTVTPLGSILGVALGGPVNVTVTIDGKSATAAVTIIPGRIRFLPGDSTLVLGQTIQLAGALEDYNGAPISSTASVTWSSSNSAVATVNATTGLVTSVAAGYAFIYATAAGRTSQLNLQVGVPTQYDGHWAGSSAAAMSSGASLKVSFDVVFGQVKNFRLDYANTFCGNPVGATGAGSSFVPISENGFSLTVVAPTPGTVTATFSNSTQLTGTHSAMSLGSGWICFNQGGTGTTLSPSVPAASFYATKT